jgi:hypothetical protein
MADKKLFSKVRKLVVVGTIASLGALGGCSSSGPKTAEKSCGGRRMDNADFNKQCGSKSCGSKSCGAKAGEKSCGQKSCGK